MKKNLTIIAALAAAMAAVSCNVDDVKERVTVKTGDEILFGSSVGNDDVEADKSKTIYGQRTSTGVPVYWSAEGDKVAIYCPQSGDAAHLSTYLVTPQEGNRSTSQAVTALTYPGLLWGEKGVHNFYAFYPASAVQGVENFQTGGKITASIPVNQQPSEWYATGDTPPNSDELGSVNGATKTYYGLPNMDNAFMYAYNSVNMEDIQGVKEAYVDLKFQNLCTVLDITLQGPESGSVTITNINVTAVDGTATSKVLTGEFKCEISGATNPDPEDLSEVKCTPILSDEVRNRISIPTFRSASSATTSVPQGFITLGVNENLNVKAYLIPDTQDGGGLAGESVTLQISVSVLNGGKLQNLNLGSMTIVPHKVHRILLPHIAINTSSNNWMSNLDENIYLTELSWPGAKRVYSTANQGGRTVEEQFMDGVRAFHFHTRRLNGDIVLSDNTSVTLANAIKEVADVMTTAQADSECAFILITCGSGDTAYRTAWLSELYSLIAECQKAPATYRIYDGQVTPSTTLGDAKGKIILKVNYNVGVVWDDISNKSLPAMFSLWNGATGVETPLNWGHANNATDMKWTYQELTTVMDPDNACPTYTSTGSITMDERKQNVEDQFLLSLRDSGHETWYLNDLGGNYVSCSNGASCDGTHTAYTDYTGYTTDMNGYATELFQAHEITAPLGIILMNYANMEASSGALYHSDWLIQTIIDNNFKFALSTRPGSSTGDGSTDTGTVDTGQEVTYSDGGNVL